MTDRWPRRLALPIAILASLVIGYTLGVITSWGGAQGRTLIGYVGAPLASAVAGVSLVMACRRSSGTTRSVWTYFAVAAFAWFAGGVVHTVLGLTVGPAEGPTSLADVFYVLSAISLVAGFFILADPSLRPTRGLRSGAHVALDTWVCAGSLFSLAWAFVIAPLHQRAGLPAVSMLVDLTYPIISLVAFCVIITLALRTPRGSLLMVSGASLGVAVVTLAESAYSITLLGGGSPLGGLIDLGRFSGYLLVGAAPWIVSSRPDQGRSFAGYALLVPAGFVGVTSIAVVTGMLARGVGTGGRVMADPVLLIGGTGVLIALLVRLSWLVFDTVAVAGRTRASQERFRAMVEADGGVLALADRDGTPRYVSPAWRQLYGEPPARLFGSSFDDLVHPEDLPRVRNAVNRVTGASGATETLWERVGCRLRSGDGTWRDVEVTIGASVPGLGTDGLLLIFREASDHVALHEQLAQLIFHDDLTGLPNRAYLEERARELLHTAGGQGIPVGVVLLDIDRFVSVNEALGHASGDHVLAHVARRLRATVRPGDTVARFGSDEFGVLVADEGGAVLDLVDRLVRAVAKPFSVAGRKISLSASAGAALAGEGSEISDLLHRADIALARAKRRGGGCVEVSAESVPADVARRRELSSRLAAALEREELAVEYQPIVDLRTSRVTGVEALVRWLRDGTWVSPEDFIEHAEETGLIVPIGQWVLNEACRQVAEWRRTDWQIGLCVNVSARQFAEPGFVETVSRGLDESGLPASSLTLEVRDGVFGERVLEGADDTLDRLRELRRVGARLAIDDFGTGGAGLSHLRELPVDTLKIDASFIAALGRDDIVTTLTRNVVRLGTDLGMLVVAEGIERPEQLTLLRDMGCPRGQGYLVARPMAARGIESVLRTGLPPGSPGNAPIPDGPRILPAS